MLKYSLDSGANFDLYVWMQVGAYAGHLFVGSQSYSEAASDDAQNGTESSDCVQQAGTPSEAAICGSLLLLGLPLALLDVSFHFRVSAEHHRLSKAHHLKRLLRVSPRL